MTTVPVSARSSTIEPSLRENSARCTCTTALRKIERKGPVLSTSATTACSSGLAWMSSADPWLMTSSTMLSAITVRTSWSLSATFARSAKWSA